MGYLLEADLQLFILCRDQTICPFSMDFILTLRVTEMRVT